MCPECPSEQIVLTARGPGSGLLFPPCGCLVGLQWKWTSFYEDLKLNHVCSMSSMADREGSGVTARSNFIKWTYLLPRLNRKTSFTRLAKTFHHSLALWDSANNRKAWSVHGAVPMMQSVVSVEEVVVSGSLSIMNSLLTHWPSGTQQWREGLVNQVNGAVCCLSRGR